MNLFPNILAVAEGSTQIAVHWDDPGIIALKLFAILLLVLLNGFFVASEFALVKVRASQLEALVDQGVRGARAARHAAQHLDAYLSATQLGITLASLGLGWLGEPFLAAMLEPFFVKAGLTSVTVIHAISFVIAFTLITVMHIVFGELAPKSLAIRKAAGISLAVAAPLGLFYSLFRPFILLLNGFANWFLRRVLRIEPCDESELSHSEEELRLILAESQKADEVTSLGKEIVINALDLKHRIARDIMTPRGDVVYLDIEDTFENQIATAIESRHTRFPLCREHLDDAFGLVHIKDLLTLVHEGKKDLQPIRRELLHVSEMMPLEKLLRLFLTKHAHLAVAVDEYGGAVGIVTLDNVIEELVGAIQDEFDTAEDEYQHLGECEFEIEGTHALYELEDKLDHKFGDTEVTTIGGFITSELGHLPVKGETARIGEWVATVTDSDGRRVLRVHLKKDPTPEVDEDEKDLESRKA
ncbi:MAG TPA: hemolysin family protein [Chthoniobacterales bacterium]|nr:hemolysin family protein [Chthoniobacterales bacterium]